MFEKQVIRAAFGRANGSFEVEYWDGEVDRFGSEAPSFRILVRDPSIIRLALKDPQMAVPDGYVEGLLDVQGDLRDVAEMGLRSVSSLAPYLGSAPAQAVKKAFGRRAALREARENVQQHYDLGNDFYSLWLDPSLSYSCAYFYSPDQTIEEAQRNKIHLVLSKLQLKSGQRLLDIGCGWGALVIEAAREYGVSAVGITLAEEQVRLARERVSEAGVQEQVSIQSLDYREIPAGSPPFDAIASVGMLEHVGRDAIPEFMDTVKAQLKPGGLALLHFITKRRELAGWPWGKKYIFPGGYIPSLRQIIHEAGERDLRVVDVQNLRPHYALTLDKWSENFDRVRPQVQAKFDERFVRMWWLFLRGAAALFGAGLLEVHQVLLSNGSQLDAPLTRAGWADRPSGPTVEAL